MGNFSWSLMKIVIVKVIIEICLTYVNFNKLIRYIKQRRNVIQIPLNDFVKSVKLRRSLKALESINLSINQKIINRPINQLINHF